MKTTFFNDSVSAAASLCRLSITYIQRRIMYSSVCKKHRLHGKSLIISLLAQDGYWSIFSSDHYFSIEPCGYSTFPQLSCCCSAGALCKTKNSLPMCRICNQLEFLFD
jgi:hypothetical protein